MSDGQPWSTDGPEMGEQWWRDTAIALRDRAERAEGLLDEAVALLRELAEDTVEGDAWVLSLDAARAFLAALDGTKPKEVADGHA